MFSCVKDNDPNDASIPFGGAANGNIDDDPLFADADGADDTVGTLDDDLRLPADSPCIDVGDNTLVPFGVTTDLDGDPRINDGDGDGTTTVDMGAYEAPPAPLEVVPALTSPGRIVLGLLIVASAATVMRRRGSALIVRRSRGALGKPGHA